jgi:putative endonuclease
MSDDVRHHLGKLGERLAREHLERLGYTVLAANHRTRWGELDLVVHGEDAVVFVEVKTRRAGGDPFEALGARKQLQVRKMAAAWLAQTSARPQARDLRFDAIGVVIDARGRLVRLDHLEAAF